MAIREVKIVSVLDRFGALLLCGTFAMAAQQPVVAAPAPQQVQSSSGASSNGPDRQLLLDVLVTNKSGKPVADLQQKDFSVLDDHRPAEILSFKAHNTEGLSSPEVDTSTEVILILDEVNAPFDRVTYAREEIEKFLKQNGGRLIHPTSLAFLSDDGLQIQTQPAVDGNDLAAALEKQGQAFRTVEHGTQFGESDRLRISQNALDQLITREEIRPGRKMVVWVGPGWSLLSGLRIVLTSSEMQQIFHSAVRFSTGLRKARITLYSVDTLGPAGVGTARSSYYQNFTGGLTKPDNAVLGNLGLQVLAVQSGGRAIFGNATVEDSLNHCVADLKAFYTMSVGAEQSQRPDQYHSLEVKAGQPGLKVLTRSGYYAQP